MATSTTDWYRDQDSLLGELRRGGYGPGEIPHISGFDDIREIRRGGQGIVYSAIQLSTKRRVAVKVLLEGAFASATARQRFEREIDLVAGLRHPNIVSVFDSGATSDGRLYFVMAYIDGRPLDQYLARTESDDDQRSDPIRLLQLFTRIGDAVNYAHQRGVIHRDLKPGNILVDTADEPHVCDFGLAKLTTEGPDDPAMQGLSVTGQFMGSLPWASPEQLEGNRGRVDVRTDIYSMGVILYHLMCGRMPYPCNNGIRQLFESIQKDEPPRPSSVNKGLNDEIDTIVMKCLSKDVNRRYQSTAELVADIRHYLAGEPIQAKRDSAWYTLRKTLRRYQLAAGATAVVMVALTVGLGASIYSWREARQESAQRAAIGDFLHGMLTTVDPGNDGAKVLFLDVINKAAAEIGPTVHEQPQVEAGIRAILGSTYSSLGMYESAETQFQSAYELASDAFGPTDRETLALLAELPGLYAARGRMEDAERRGREALDTIRKAFGPDDALTLTMLAKLGDILNQCGKTSEAESHLRSTLSAQQRVLGVTHRDTLGTMNTLAVLLKQMGRTQDAEALYRRVIEEGIRADGKENPGVLTVMNNLALALQSQGKLDESEAMQRQVLESRRMVLGENHPDTLVNMSNLATLLIERRKLDDAERLLSRVVEIETRTLGPENPATLTALNNLAKVVQDLGRFDDAQRLFRQALDGRRRIFGDDHSSTLMTEANLAALLGASGHADDAIKLLQKVLDARRRTLGDSHFDTLVTQNNLGMMLQKQGKPGEAAAYFESACMSASQSLPESHYVTALFCGNYGRCLIALGKYPQAADQLERSCKVLEATLGKDDPRTQQNIQSLVEASGHAGKSDIAAAWRVKLLSKNANPP